MIGIYLTQSTTPIIGWVAKILGFIMEGIFNLLNLMRIPNIGLAIILFTIVIYLLMLPLTIKQQKFSKLSAKMNPEIQAIQAKYKNKKDNDSIMAMNQETQEVYAKYGVSPTGSCVQLLIQMPILFALYKVIYAMPAYVGRIKDTFLVLVNKIITSEGGMEYINNSIAYAQDPKNTENVENFISAVKTANMYSGQFKTDAFVNGANTIQQYIESGNMAGLETALTDGSLSTVQNTIIDVLNKASASELHAIADKFDVSALQQNGQYIIDQLSAGGEVIQRGLLETYNNFLGINIANSPSVMVKEAMANGAWLLLIAAIAIPVLSAVTQWINIKLMPQANSGDNRNKNDQENTMASTMKTMNMFMPIMSAFFCYTMPSGLGLYWIAGSIVRSIQQVLINKHIDKMDLDELIAKNKKKGAKKMEKLKANQERINAYANMNTKNINNNSTAPKVEAKRTMSDKAKVSPEEKAETLKKSTDYYNSKNAKPGSIAAKANMVKQYNEKNNK